MNEDLESRKAEKSERSESRKLEIDWTKSEWFAVWLRLARGEYQPKPEPITAPSVCR
jgi:hypothetical protein